MEPETEQVPVLLILELTEEFDTSCWPLHMNINPGISALVWGGLDAAIRVGATSPGEASHLVALTFDDKDYPDWLPKATLAGPWCSKVISPLLEHSLKGDMPESEGVQLWPLGTEAPVSQVQPDSVRVSIRGEPVGEPTVRHCWTETGQPSFQAAISLKARHIVFRAFRLHPDREELQRELDSIIAAGDVQVIGMMEDGGGDEVSLDVMVEHWAPVQGQL